MHLIGIKGVAMTALAQVLKARGLGVTGSDGPAQFFTDAILKKLKIKYARQFSPSNIPKDVDAVISSAAYLHNGKVLDNVEVEAALKKKIPTYTYPEVMGELTRQYETIAVTGSHGKSTTSALLAHVLTKCGVNPTAIIGSRVNSWKANARVASSAPSVDSGQAGSGQGKKGLLVIEADEYREAFLKYSYVGGIITSIDYDHPDYFKTPAQYSQAFLKFTKKIPKSGFLVICGDDHQVAQLGIYARTKKVRTLSYGFGGNNDIVVREAGVKRQTAAKGEPQQLLTVLFNGKRYSGTIPFVGKQYVLNSGATFGVAMMLGIEPAQAIAAMASFSGTARRLETVKKAKDYIIIDDYAHHPTAINITLEGVRAMYPKRHIVAVFQPHMFSRTQALLEPFAKSFGHADEVGIMEIYPSARETTGPVNGRDLAARAKFYHPRLTYLPTMEAGKQYVKQHAKNNNVIVLMGAGNVNELAN